jgi:signal transduction histidine kinase
MSGMPPTPPAAPRWWRLTPAFALMTVIVLLSAGVLMARYADQENARQEVQEMAVQGRILATTIAAALVSRDLLAAQDYVDAIQANPRIRVAAVYDAAGRLLVAYRAEPAATLPGTVTQGPPRVVGDRVVVAVAVRQRGQIVGTIYLRGRTEADAARLLRYGAIGLLVTMASAVVAVLAMMQSVQRRSNDALARHAAQLAAANQALELQIAQREKAEEALRQAQKMEAIGQLTGGVAHDFNNLLQVILGNLERLSRRLPASGADATRLIEAAMRAAGRAATLTQRLLAFARRQPLAPRPLDLNRLVVDTLELLGRSLGEKVRVETQLAGGLWQVFADENQLESALVNLAVNARDAIPNGGCLTLETRNIRLDEAYARSQQDVRAGDYVLLSVSDTGSGMTAEVLARAFDPFFTTKQIGQGTGLGLSQVYGFVRQSDGHVRIDSAPGKGTSVKMYLPRFLGPARDGAGSERPQDVTPGQWREAILVVEDAPDVRSLTRDTLRELGYEVREACDGHSALVVLEREPGLRLMFADVGLPGGLNGCELADEAVRRRPGLKVLLTTGYGGDAVMRPVRLSPGMGILPKPFSEVDLARKIRQLLDG